MIPSMSLLYGKRVPEPEVMDRTGEVEAYASAAASDHLDRLDSACAEAIRQTGATAGWWLDAGCGPGQITCKVAVAVSTRIAAVDRAFGMLEQAQAAAAALGLKERIFCVQADALALPFRDAVFDLVFSNSLLHHLSHPAAFLAEAGRVGRPGGKFFLRDLVRPLRWRLRRHIDFHGRNYSGLMLRLFEASVRAAYTAGEARRMLKTSPLRDGRVSRAGDLYLVIRQG